MDMGTSTMTSMSGMSMTMTSAASTASSTATSSMDMGMGACKISMLWSWHTIDACFISSSWHITSRGMFAGTCIGVILLVISLEFLRRSAKEYDRYILRQFQRAGAAHPTSYPYITPSCPSPLAKAAEPANSSRESVGANSVAVRVAAKFRPNVMQQAIRATLHMLQFAVAYFIMLLAMYYNGYIIMCIFIGAWIGAFGFSWEMIEMNGPQEETTICCG
ncbi:Copper transport protein [Lachnellula hyalina]|uniref:Copper transport protein n=1 Tax=Lachnellula hyalina TaxID=1316788 RepID=A0A8H8TZI3_9HELO|nr:Copper transport protein [Lachnellula hyalina]TVY25001.1 Copper transport protein [Lachnellula hyalina]